MAQFELHVFAHVGDDLASLRQHLLQGERRQIERDEAAAPVKELLKFERKVRLTVVEVHAAPDGGTLEALMEHEGDAPIDGMETIELASKLPKGFVDAATVGFSPLDTGVFQLSWIAIAQDGHVMEGDVYFAVSE